jgi:hypothetical protein
MNSTFQSVGTPIETQTDNPGEFASNYFLTDSQTRAIIVTEVDLDGSFCTRIFSTRNMISLIF